MTTLLDVPRPVGVGKPGRSRELDALRGLAILLMVADHLALFLELPEVRSSVGRAAMPLFFLIGGHLATRYAWRRWAGIVLVGLVLQGLAPWSGAGPLLCTFVVGAAVLVALRRDMWVLVLLVAAGLTVGANGYGEVVNGAYDPRCLVGLMALGALVPREVFHPARRLPAFLATAGRHPLALYAGHVLLLTVLWT